MDLHRLEMLHQEVACCDAMHHYYHYTASWLHLCYAQNLLIRGDAEGARKQFKAALFQDHLNQVALKALDGVEIEAVYDTHLSSGAAAKLNHYEASIGWEPDSSMEYALQGEFAEALRIFGARHERYHHHASALHVARGKMYVELAELDLAINDLTKALDLNRHNREAIILRSDLYGQRGSWQLAEADELRLARMNAL